MLELPPLALYVHLPWCVRKCPYCDFNSHAAPAALPFDAYAAALLEDLDLAAPAAAGRSLQSVFFGGGTPSLFPPEVIDRLLTGIAQQLAGCAGLEVTMEANPGAIERGRFAEYRAAGVNRISLGAQSFDDRALEALGRIHDARETNQAVAELIAAGFENFNLDLMYGLPGQSVAAAIADLERALQLDPTHISHYQLTLEPGTVFYRRPPRLPDADAAYEMQLECQTRLAARGFAQYEVSAYARPGFACRHNLNYWRFGDYLGIGAGAHGKWTEPATRRIVRTVRCRHPREYLAAARPADRVAAVTEVSRVDRPFEYLLNVLRLRESFTAASFEARTGLPLDVIARPLATACDRGLLCEPASSQWQVTELGRRFLNDLQALFLPDENSGALAPAGLA